MKKTNFDRYLEEQLRDPAFRRRFEEASEEWDLAIQLARLRREKWLTQEQLAERVGTNQQQISRLENPTYHGRSLRTLRKVAEALGAEVEIRIVPSK